MNVDFLKRCAQVLDDLICTSNSYLIQHLTIEDDGQVATFARDSNGEWFLVTEESE